MHYILCVASNTFNCLFIKLRGNQMKDERIFFLVSKAQKDFLKRKGEEQERSVSYVLRKLIDNAMEKENAEKSE